VPLLVPAVAAAATSTPAFADSIDDAAKELSAAAYPYLKEVDWNSNLWLKRPGTASPGDWMKAIDKALVMGASMDPGWLSKGGLAHHNAIKPLTNSNPVCSQEDFAAINSAIGHMVASVPESQALDVFSAFGKVVPNTAAPYIMSTVKQADAEAAYAAFWKFKDVVKANPVQPNFPETPQELLAKHPAIEAAASKLADLSFPFLKDYNWKSDLPMTPLPGVQPVDIAKAIDKMIVMASAMDGKLLSEATLIHHKAIEKLDPSNLLLTPKEHEAICASIGKLVASVPSSLTMDVFGSMGQIIPQAVINNVNSMVNAKDATNAYSAFMDFKDTVKASLL